MYNFYLLYAVPLLVVALIYVRRRVGHQSQAASTWDEVIESGLTEPPTLHPSFDPTKCFGSGACEPVCPTKAIVMVAMRDDRV